jgi:hypothetical protein
MRDTENNMEVLGMERKTAKDLVMDLKKAKEDGEVTYPRIMERIESTGRYVSLTTLRRVFAEGSELNASSFSYENTLIPIADALLPVEETPTPADNPYAKEIAGLKAVIRTQNEEISHLYELKEHLDERITFLLDQIAEKDKMISKLLDQVLVCSHCPVEKK